MPKFVPLAAAAAAVALVAAVAAVAGSAKAVYTYKAVLAVGTEVPRPKAPATAKGLFTATVTDSGTSRIVKWKLTFTGLSGKAVAAHIHKGKAGSAGGVLLPLCGPCTSGQSGQATISSDVADALERGLAYANVHTARNAAGEIRGQARLVKRVGAPSTEPEPTPSNPAPGSGGSDAPSYGY